MIDRYGERDDADEHILIEDAVDLVRRSRAHLTAVPSGMTKREAREELRRQRISAQTAAAAARAAGTAACNLCNDDGYTATLMVCDHIDRTDTYRHGSSLVRAMMGWTRTTGTPTAPPQASPGVSQGVTWPDEPHPTQEARRDALGRSRGVRC